ncbi:MAG: flippase [Melioribacter sp.]|nr:flippase [Melioribacter sp.]
MTETSASILSNAKTMFVTQIITWTSSFFLMMFLPRYLGADAYGRLYFAISLTMLGGLIIDLGFSNYFVKEVARDRTKVNLFFMNGVGLRIIAWLIAMIIMFLYVYSTGYTSEMLTLLLILGFQKLLETISDLAHRIFQSFERLSFRSIAVIIERVSLSAISVTMLLLGYGVITIAWVMTFSTLLNFLTCLFLLPRLVTMKMRITVSSWMELIRGSLPFLISTFFSFVYYRIDVIMLSAMTNDSVVGWYGAPYRLFDTMMFFPSILQMAVFPVFSRLWKQSRDDFFINARRSLDATIIIGFLIAFCLIALSRPIVDLLFGLEHYSNSVILLQVLALTLPLVYANFILGTVDTSSDKQKELSIVSIIATFINIGLNFWLIPLFQKFSGNGAIGAGIATLITEICVLVMFGYLLPRGCFGKENLLVVWKSFIAATISGILLWYIESKLKVWLVSGIICAAVYTVLLIATNVLTKRELNIALSLFPKRWKDTASRFSGL